MDIYIYIQWIHTHILYASNDMYLNILKYTICINLKTVCMWYVCLLISICMTIECRVHQQSPIKFDKMVLSRGGGSNRFHNKLQTCIMSALLWLALFQKYDPFQQFCF